MKISGIAACAMATALLGTGSALAQGDELAGAQSEAGIMPTPVKYTIGENAGLTDARQRLAIQGFAVQEMEVDGRRIEVKGLTATGHCLELKFNAASGKETRRKRDDDCRG